MVNINNIEWFNPGHKQRRYDLRISSCHKYFKKSTNRLHKTLEMEFKCLTFARDLKLDKIQQLVDGHIDKNGESYIITEYCGHNITRSQVPSDWSNQLDIIDEQLQILIDKHKVYHNDVQVRNLFVRSKKLTLIDFDLATIGAPNRRAGKRPGFLKCDYIRDKFIDRWNIA